MDSGAIAIRPLRAEDLSDADHIFRLAFGTFLKLDPPESFGGDAAFIEARWKAEHTAAFVAEVDGKVVGVLFIANWGTVGYFGPLTIRPDYWDRGVGKRLVETAVDQFAAWQTRHAGLYTFSNSPKHISLYQKFGFHPRFLTMNMSRPVVQTADVPHAVGLSEVGPADRIDCLEACRKLTDAIYEGLDVRGEIKSVASESLGETVLLWEPDRERLAGFAVCHLGAGSEAGSGVCYIKFAAARPGPDVENRFTELLKACEVLGSSRGASRVLGGMNTARSSAYASMLASGFRVEGMGVTMHRPNEPGYSRSDVFLIDDWR
jgi:GNAT superfamily N-acetyltransferase